MQAAESPSQAPPTCSQQLLSFNVLTGDAFQTDGDTGELSRKFFIVDASDEFSQAKRRADPVRSVTDPTTPIV